MHLAKWNQLETRSEVTRSIYKPRQMFKGKLRHKEQMADEKAGEECILPTPTKCRFCKCLEGCLWPEHPGIYALKLQGQKKLAWSMVTAYWKGWCSVVSPGNPIFHENLISVYLLHQSDPFHLFKIEWEREEAINNWWFPCWRGPPLSSLFPGVYLNRQGPCGYTNFFKDPIVGAPDRVLHCLPCRTSSQK